MRVLVLHSDIPPAAPPDEQDTLIQAEAIAQALTSRGHDISKAAFTPDLAALLEKTQPDILFNVVEAVEGSGYRAAEAIDQFERLGITFTGNRAQPMRLTCDKPLTKTHLAQAGLPTPGWAVPPFWDGLEDGKPYIVKSAREDASLGLDDASVITGCAAIKSRAAHCAQAHDGDWFAERYIEGREFNVALLDGKVLPIAELRFEHWPSHRPRIVGYSAKWDENSHEAVNTPRDFTWSAREPELAAQLKSLSEQAWKLFGLSGYARVDFRVDEAGPAILELNPNPCLSPDAGFAAAAKEAGLNYSALVEKILTASLCA